MLSIIVQIHCLRKTKFGSGKRINESNSYLYLDRYKNSNNREGKSYFVADIL